MVMLLLEFPPFHRRCSTKWLYSYFASPESMAASTFGTSHEGFLYVLQANGEDGYVTRWSYSVAARWLLKSLLCPA